MANGLFSAFSGHFLAHFWSYFAYSRFGKWAKLVSMNVLSAVPTLFQPVPLKCMVLRPIWPILSYLDLLWPALGHFWNQRANFCTIFELNRDPKLFDYIPLMCSILVPPRPTQNRPSRPICVANRLFSAYLGHFLAHLVPYLGHPGYGKWAKLVSLNVLSAVPTLFNPVPLKFMVLRTI